MKIKKIYLFLIKNKFHILAISIIIITGLFFRFYNYSNRWGLASDQARDSLVVLTALQKHVLPLIGPFSASGPFVFGPYYYWFLMLLGLFSFGSIFSIWVWQSIISFFLIFFRILIGKEIEDIKFGYLLGFFAAISSIRVELSTNLVSSTLVGMFSTITAYFFVRCVKYKTLSSYFLLGLFTSLAINTHFQAIPLVSLLFFALILGKRSIKHILFLFLGFVIPFTPLLIFDLRSNFFESSHFIQYIFFNNNASITTRWLIYIGETWPNIWASIIGGNYYIAVISMICLIILLVRQAFKKSLSLPMVGIAGFVLLIFIFFRYFNEVLFGNFISFFASFVLILITWMCIRLVKINRLIGILAIVILTVFTMESSYKDIINATNYTSLDSQLLEKLITEEFPENSKFQFYDYQYKSSSISLPLLLYMNDDNKLNDNGIKIGVAQTTEPKAQIINEVKTYYHVYLFNLNSFTEKQLREADWDPISPESVFNATENWYKN